MARIQLGDSRLKARRRRRRVLLAGLTGVLVLALVGAVVGLSWLPFLRITAVSIAGTHAIEPGAIEQLVRQDIAGGYGYLFAKSNIFLYPKATITEGIKKTFPTIKSVVVGAENFHTLTVSVVERQPVAVWCGSMVASSSPCYFLDEDGFAYAPAAQYSGDAYQKYYGSLAQGQFLAPERFRSLLALVTSLQKEANTGAVSSIFVDTDGDAHLTFASGFTLLFGIADDGGGVVQRFVLARSANPFLNTPLSSFEYLDLRFGDKVYYKVKGK